MDSKMFKTVDEQIGILKSKGLIINNEEYAKKILLKENYFFISGYRYLFCDENKKYRPGTTIEEIFSLFNFDRELRSIFLKSLFIIENHFKSVVSYQLSKKYGYKEDEYLKPENFTKDPEKAAQVKDILGKMKRQIRHNTTQHKATLHYISIYGYIPLWVLVKVLSFGIVSEFYSILKTEDRKEIAEQFWTNPESLEDYLAILANYRNICAHEDILYENRTQRYIGGTKYHKELNIEKTEDGYIKGTDDLFSLVIILKIMITETEFQEMIYKINAAITKLDIEVNSIDIKTVYDKMGFPTNWKEIENL